MIPKLYPSSNSSTSERTGERARMAAGSLADLERDVVPARYLLTAKQAAAACGRSLRTWRTWDSAARIPRPVRIGRSTLWRADELARWVAAGCPRRAEWEAMQ